MCREQLIIAISASTGLKRSEIRAVLDAFQQLTAETLSNGEQVVLSGFGTFSLKSRNPRIGRNPHTGEPVEIPSRVIPSFTPSDMLRTRISGESSEKKSATKSPRISPAK